MNDFTTFRRRLRLKGKLVLETSLRLGAGRTDELSGAEIAVVKDELRRPYIPGSSFKGALRAHIERLVRAALPGRRGACNPVSEDERCITREEMARWREEARQESTNTGEPADAILHRRVLGQSCLVCRLFGSPWLAGKVQVRDLMLANPERWLERRYELRHGIGIDRDSETVGSGLLFSYEAVPAGTAFEWEIVVENPDIYEYRVDGSERKAPEEGMLLLALREMKEGRIRLGGARSRGLGWMRLTFGEAELVDATDRAAFVDYLVTGQPTKMLDEKALMELAADFGRYLGYLATTAGKEV